MLSEAGSMDKLPADALEIVESLRCAGKDIKQLGKLMAKERFLVKQFFTTLKNVKKVAPSIAVSTKVFPKSMGKVTKAVVYPTGKLALMFKDGRHLSMDLSEFENRDLMIAVARDIAPKFECLVEDALSKFNASSAVEMPVMIEAPVMPQPEPVPQPAPQPEPQITFQPPQVIEPTAPPALVEPKEPAKPVEAPAPAPNTEPAPVLSIERNVTVDSVASETLTYLEMLGSEVFQQAPVSMYFDDWMVNLRQVMLSFESDPVLGGVDDEFTNETKRVFSNIEEELSKRLLKEAELEISTKTLAENKNMLGELDEGYAKQTKNLIVKGKSALDFLTNNVQHLEQELAEIELIKTSYLHPLKALAKEQRKTDITEKLNAAKKRLVLTVQRSPFKQSNIAGVNADANDLEAKRQFALDFLAKEVRDLEAEIVKINQIQTNNLVKRTAKQQKLFDTKEKLRAAKKRLEVAKQGSSVDQEMIFGEYEKNKQAAEEKVNHLEKAIATEGGDGSLPVRKTATEALANAVKGLIERKKAPPPP